MTADASGEGLYPLPRAAGLAPSGTASGVEPSPGSAEPPDATPVTFTQDVDGAWLRWSVVERDARAVPGARGARCLVFTRPDCIRRVWDYPAHWRALDGAGLAALSWHQ